MQCRRFDFRRFADRQEQAEDGFLAGLTLAFDGAAVGGGNFADDRQAQAAAARSGMAGHAEIALEDRVDEFRRDAAAGVGNGEGNSLAGRRGGERDAASLGRVRKRVIEQVLQGVVKLVDVDGHFRQVGRRGN